jgi:hypothetical protein
LSRSTHPSALLLPDRDVRRLLVQPDSKPFQLICEDRQVDQGLEHVEDDENEVTGPGDGNDLSPTTFAVLCTLNDTGQIEDLYSGAVVVERSRDGGEGCEFV